MAHEDDAPGVPMLIPLQPTRKIEVVTEDAAMWRDAFLRAAALLAEDFAIDLSFDEVTREVRVTRVESTK
jgi:hypothetical protein